MTDLYRHFDSRGALLYVGISLNTIYRTMQHRQDSHWFSDVATIEIEKHPSRDAALTAEARAIETERPKHNKTGPKEKRFDDALVIACQVEFLADFDLWWRQHLEFKSRADAIRALMREAVESGK